MITLICTLISIIGYGIPDNFTTLSQNELHFEIDRAEAHALDGGTFGDWEVPGVALDPSDPRYEDCGCNEQN